MSTSDVIPVCIRVVVHYVDLQLIALYLANFPTQDYINTCGR